jgi:ribose 5-phosphate isomerase A
MDLKKAKQAAAQKAVAYVEDGMIVGLGTGSTAYFAIQLIGEKIRAGLKILGVPTSNETAKLAKVCQIPLLSQFSEIDLTIDGADEVDPDGNLIKGGGGALTREKIVAAASKTAIIIVDETKLVQQLGKFPLPVEVLPFGWESGQKQLQSLGCTTRLRKKGTAPFITDNQNWILDCQFDRIVNPGKLTIEINAIPGVVENGLFASLADLVIVGKEDGSTKEYRF